MAYSNFIAAIDIGTTHFVGIVGTKNVNGFSIIAYEIEDTDNCIRRGCVYNVNETASKIKRLILKLENKLNGSKIAKVYVGVGGQSIRTINHTVSRVFAEESVMTDDIIESLQRECLSFHPDLLSILDVVSPTYILDDKEESNPVGVSCKRIEVNYKLIVGRPSVKQNVINSIESIAKVTIAKVIVSPLALADVVLNDDEKQSGCALVNFGGGVTSITIFNSGKMVDLCVIPLGSQLITKDIMSKNIVEKEAERLKVTYGRATTDKENNPSIMVEKPSGLGMKEMKQNELNQVVQARVNEILENVYARIKNVDVKLSAGIVLAGGGSSLKCLSDEIREHEKLDVRFASIRRDIMEKGDVVAGNPTYLVAIGLLAKGTENCAQFIKPVEPKRPETTVIWPKPETPDPDTARREEEQRKKKEEERKKKEEEARLKAAKKNNKKPSRFKDIFEKIGGSIFDESDTTGDNNDNQ